MTPEEVAKLRPGLYLVFRSGGGTAHAAVGRGHDGRAWLACTDDLVPGEPSATVLAWEFVDAVQPLTGPDAKEPLDPLEAVTGRLSRIRALAVSESEPRAKDKIVGLVDELDRMVTRAIEQRRPRQPETFPEWAEVNRRIRDAAPPPRPHSYWSWTGDGTVERRRCFHCGRFADESPPEDCEARLGLGPCLPFTLPGWGGRVS